MLKSKKRRRQRGGYLGANVFDNCYSRFAELYAKNPDAFTVEELEDVAGASGFQFSEADNNGMYVLFNLDADVVVVGKPEEYKDLLYWVVYRCGDEDAVCRLVESVK